MPKLHGHSMKAAGSAGQLNGRLNFSISLPPICFLAKHLLASASTSSRQGKCREALYEFVLALPSRDEGLDWSKMLRSRRASQLQREQQTIE